MTTYTCPLCATDVPVAATKRRSWRRWRTYRLIFTEQSWADVYAHLWSHR